MFSFLLDAPVHDYKKQMRSFSDQQNKVDQQAGSDLLPNMDSRVRREVSAPVSSKDTTKTEKRCVLLDSDDRTTGM